MSTTKSTRSSNHEYQRMNKADEYAAVSEAEAARILGMRSKTLRNWRSSDIGPPFVKYGSRQGLFDIQSPSCWHGGTLTVRTHVLRRCRWDPMNSHRRQSGAQVKVGRLIASFDRQWYGDGAPQWTEAAGKRWARPCCTAADARELRSRSIRLLRRHGSDGEAKLLADQLESCSPRHRCLSGACPECCRAHQRWFVNTARQLIRDASAGDNMCMASIVPDYGRFTLDELGELDVTLITKKMLRLLKSAGVAVAIGATDFSINVVATNAEPCLQVQFILFTPCKRVLSGRMLRQALNTNGMVMRPVRVREFDGDNAGLAYALKYEFVLREGYSQRSDSRADKRNCRNTRSRPLRGQKWLAMALLLDRIGLFDRLALLGARRIRQSGMMSMRYLYRINHVIRNHKSLPEGMLQTSTRQRWSDMRFPESKCVNCIGACFVRAS